MKDRDSLNSPTSKPIADTVEVHQRFQRLRLLITDTARRQRLIFVLSLLCLAIVSLLAALVAWFPVLSFDITITRDLQRLNNSLFLQVMVFVSLFGYLPWSAIVVVMGTLLVGILLGWRDGLYLLFLSTIQTLVNQLIKVAVGRPRPLSTLVEVFTPVSGNSFPSGHVMFYTVFFGFLFFLAWTRLPAFWGRIIVMVPTGLLILLVGPSRMYLGAHWLSDVIAAYLFGIIILAFGIEFYLRQLAPKVVAKPEGLVGAHDQAVK